MNNSFKLAQLNEFDSNLQVRADILDLAFPCGEGDPTLALAKPARGEALWTSVALERAGGIINELFSSCERRENPKVVLLAGPPGAGKSYRSREICAEGSGEFVVIDNDHIKYLILKDREWLQGQTGNESSTVDVYKAILFDVLEGLGYSVDQGAGGFDGLHVFPLELASYVHSFASYVTGQAVRRAFKEGYSFIWDMTFSDYQKVDEMFQHCSPDATWDISLVDVEAGHDASVRSIRNRWRGSVEMALEGNRDQYWNPRWVPSSVVDSHFFDNGKFSNSFVNSLRLGCSRTDVSSLRVYVNMFSSRDGEFVGSLRLVDLSRPDSSQAKFSESLGFLPVE